MLSAMISYGPVVATRVRVVIPTATGKGTD